MIACRQMGQKRNGNRGQPDEPELYLPTPQVRSAPRIKRQLSEFPRVPYVYFWLRASIESSPETARASRELPAITKPVKTMRIVFPR